MTPVADRKLYLGDDGAMGAVLQRIPDEWWDEKKSPHRWYGFPGDGIAVWVQIEVQQDGRSVSHALHIESAEPLSTTALREVPVARLVSLAAQYGAEATKSLQYLNLPSSSSDPDPTKMGTMASEPYFDVDEFLRPEPPLRHPGRRGHDRAFYEKVARVWTAALVTHPGSPIARTAKELGVDRNAGGYSKAQARRLVRKAEELGLVKKGETK